MKSPQDHEGSKAITEVLEAKGISGAKAVVLATDDKGSVAIITIDFADFNPVRTNDGIRKQAIDVIKGIVAANNDNTLNLQRTGVHFQEDGSPIITLSAPISALNGIAGNEINDSQFHAKVDVKIYSSAIKQYITK